MTQPAPTPNDQPAIWDLLIEAMRERDRKGVETYGVRLQPFNGRQALADAFDEQLDGLAYLKQAMIEWDALVAERDKLQAFKDWTHRYLDSHGVPHHPPGTHGAEGCRIGDRMDWLMAKLETAERRIALLEKAISGEVENL